MGSVGDCVSKSVGEAVDLLHGPDGGISGLCRRNCGKDSGGLRVCTGFFGLLCCLCCRIGIRDCGANSGRYMLQEREGRIREVGDPDQLRVIIFLGSRTGIVRQSTVVMA